MVKKRLYNKMKSTCFFCLFFLLVSRLKIENNDHSDSYNG